MDCSKAEYNHKAIVELMCYSDKFIFGFKKKQEKNMHFSLRRMPLNIPISLLVNSNKQPHSDYIKHNMNIAHVLFVDIVVGEPVEE